MPLFDRQIEVVLNLPGVSFSADNVRIDFEIMKSTDVSSNSAKVQVYNLSIISRNQIQELNDLVTIKAGYAQDVGAKLIFTGEMLRVTHENQPPDIVTIIEAGDGISQMREARDSISFAEGTGAKNVLDDLSNKLGLPIRNLPSEIKGQYLHGFSHVGSVRDALDRVTKRENLEWSVQNGELLVLPKRKPLDGEAVLIAPERGMLNLPERLRDLNFNLVDEQKKPGFKVRSLLNPNIEAGSKVRLQTSIASGEFRVEVVRHVGSNFANDFYTEIEIYEL